MKIDEIRIYAEVLEQGLDFKKYLIANGADFTIKNIYAKKTRAEITATDSRVDRIRKAKDVDVFLTAISDGNEYPLLMVEYSTAVPTDDHKMQRSDVFFWAALYKVPALKIFADSKGMSQDFGGGKKISWEHELVLAHRKGAVYYPIAWKCISGKEILDANPNALSCIGNNEQIAKLLSESVSLFLSSTSYESWYAAMKERHERKYSDIFAKYEHDDLKALIKNSTRFQWNGQKLSAKINRFGHGMDPDRGVLYFVNMLVGLENTIAEIQVNRSSDFNARAGYKSLFDGAAHESELCDYVKNIIADKDNVFSSEDALHVLTQALALPSTLIQKTDENTFNIDDADLYRFLIDHPGMSAKSIFFLSTCLILSDKDRNEICRITWNPTPIRNYYQALMSDNYCPRQLKRLSMTTAKEDLVTFASVLLYQKMQSNLLAVSYPGAQGDRCFLTGTGKKAKRTYIDVIASQTIDGKVYVYLEECKDSIKKSHADVRKLNKIKNDPTYNRGLKLLCNKLAGITHIDDVILSLGAKSSPIQTVFNVDYIFMFDVDKRQEACTRLNYAIAFINTNIANNFKPLIDSNGRATGYLELDPIYVLK